jgi:hypothetical protein
LVGRYTLADFYQEFAVGDRLACLGQDASVTIEFDCVP